MNLMIKTFKGRMKCRMLKDFVQFSYLLLDLHSFLSTPKFIKHLTDIAEILGQMHGTRQDKLLRLKEELKKVNEQLPATVYIPFVNCKNYLV